MCKEKKKEETERERVERLNRKYNDVDWVVLYNFDKLLSLRVDEISLYFSHHKITFKREIAEKKGLNDLTLPISPCSWYSWIVRSLVNG